MCECFSCPLAKKIVRRRGVLTLLLRHSDIDDINSSDPAYGSISFSFVLLMGSLFLTYDFAHSFCSCMALLVVTNVDILCDVPRIVTSVQMYKNHASGSIVGTFDFIWSILLFSWSHLFSSFILINFTLRLVFYENCGLDALNSWTSFTWQVTNLSMSVCRLSVFLRTNLKIFL